MSINWGSINVNLEEHQDAYEEAKRRIGISNVLDTKHSLSEILSLAESVRQERIAKQHRADTFARHGG
jgi:hypothetical protein